MIGYATIGTTDMEKCKGFWLELLEPLGAKLGPKWRTNSPKSRQNGPIELDND